MNSTILILDTSYLSELYKIPFYFDPARHEKIRGLFERAIRASSRLYLPFPVIFEVANHIVNGTQQGSKNPLAERFVTDMLASFEKTIPFIITPAIDEANLKGLLRRFAGNFAAKKVGLTDTSIIDEAERLKGKYGAHGKVHIWTLDRRLKAREPDPEPNAFVG
jgi:predicted nucleic acid-binding protein